MLKISVIVMWLLVLIKPFDFCGCDKKTEKPKGDKMYMGKRQYDDYDGRYDEEINEQTVADKSVKGRNRATNGSTEMYNTENELSNVCQYYKENQNLDMEKMIDIWEIAYYRSQSATLNCFKIHIKRVNSEKKRLYKKKYGDFNGSIEWEKCNLEITSYESNPIKMHHFLHGSPNDSGVLQNIIFIDDNTNENETESMGLQEQSPDQWMVKNNLLLMRDCSNGDVIIFTRVPFQPSIKDIKEALTQFHEDPDLGSWACEKPTIETLNNDKYNTIS